MSSASSTPLAGIRVAVCRDDAPDDDVSQALARAGAVVVALPLMRVVVDDGAKDAVTAALQERPDAVALTSRHAVPPFAAAWRAAGQPPLVVGVVGATTARAARASGLVVDVEGDAGGAALAERLVQRGVRRVLFPCAREAHDALVTRLARDAVVVDAVVVYRSEPRADVDGVLASAWSGADAARAVVVTSPQRARLLLARPIPADVVRVAIGATTAAALAQAGDRADVVAAQPSADAVVAAVCSGMLDP